MITNYWIPGLLAALFSLLGTGVVRRYALSRELLDHPNDRSSHSIATPRGGGLAILGSFILTLLLVPAGITSAEWPLWLAVGGILPTAVLGWLDDRFSLPARLRIASHFITAVSIVPLALSTAEPTSQAAASLLAAWWVFATVSAINVVNFMDGIDGLIALQALIFSVHLVLLSDASQATTLAVVLAGSAGGFLLWNWHPARIFMGDVGSGPLGALGMICGLLVLREGSGGLLSVFLPLLPLFADATVTLVRRAARGDRLSQAHREHLYQRLARGGWGHAKVALLYGGLAAAGSGVAHASGTESWPAVVAAYAGVVPALGLILERRLSAHSTVGKFKGH